LNGILLERLRAGEDYADGLRAASGYGLAQRLAALGPLALATDESDTDRLAALVVARLGDASPPPPLPVRADRPGRMSRTYVDTPYGQTLVRFREQAAGRPVILLHASPVSGLTLEGLLDGMAAFRPVYALDTIANGESDKPDLAQHPQFERPSIGEFADWLIAVLDGLGFDQVDLYGSHTGAMIALETAIRAPQRVASLILDGVTMHDAEESEEIFGGYFVDIRPRQDGGHLLTCWTQMQDVTLWHPWFVRDAAHISDFPIIRPSQIHGHVVEMLKRGAWHERCYRPVYEYPTARRLPQLRTRTLIATPPDDYLERFSAAAAELAPNARAGRAPRSVTDTDRHYAPFVPDAGVASYFLDFLGRDPPGRAAARALRN
jgi:pimeloyl-ACP methyl ester carboxylesterase